VEELFTDVRKLYRLSLAESTVDRKWDKDTFSDESTFNSTNDDLGVSDTTLSICLPANAVVVSVQCWGWISHEGARMRHHIGHFDGLQYEHVLQNALHGNALSRWYNPLPAITLLHL